MDNLLHGTFALLNIIAMIAFACSSKHKPAFAFISNRLSPTIATKPHCQLIGGVTLALGFVTACLSYAPVYFIIAWFLSLSGMAGVVYLWVMYFNQKAK